jgi:hypothetical protein
MQLATFNIDLTDQDFLDKRRVSLEKFLYQILAHPDLGRDAGAFRRRFVAWGRLSAELQTRVPHDLAPFFSPGVAEFLFGDILWRNELKVTLSTGDIAIYQPSSGPLMGMAKSSQPDRRFQDLKHYAQRLQDHINSLLSIHSR